MNRSSFALFVALLIHFIFLMLFWFLGTLTPEINKTKEKRMKVSLKEMPKKSADSGVIKKPQKQPKIAPPMPKGSQLKKLEKLSNKPYIKYDKKSVKKEKKLKSVKKATKPKPKPTPKPIIKPIPKVKAIPLPKPDIKLPEIKVDPMAWMHEDMSQQETQKEKKRKNDGVGLNNQTIKELYGEEFGELSPGQQKYILDNQEIMRRITQQVLTRVARVNLSRDINVNRTNVIEFYLHPNGDMSGFRFLKNSGYVILDETTKETIEYAYSRYPRPTEKTLIRYNVFYNLRTYR